MPKRSLWISFKRLLRARVKTLFKPTSVTLHGVRLSLRSEAVSPYIRRSVYREGYEGAEARMILETLEPDDRVLELGSGMGFIASLCALQLKDDSKVCAVEALPQMQAVIGENFRLNRISPRVISAAVGCENGECSFAVAENFWSSSAAGNRTTENTISVPMIALNDLIEDFQPTYLVVDVEGAEENLFNSDLKTVRKICLEIHPHYIGDDGVQRALDALFSQGFVICFLKSSRCVLHLYRNQTF